MFTENSVILMKCFYLKFTHGNILLNYFSQNKINIQAKWHERKIFSSEKKILSSSEKNKKNINIVPVQAL